MELHVKADTNVYEGFELEESITGFDDAEKIGLRVGRAVRDWLRAVPISKNRWHMRIQVDAQWRDGKAPTVAERAATATDAAARQRRRKRAK